MIPSLSDEGIRVFKLIRGADESGISGSGFVGYGIIDHRGKITFFWRTDKMATSKVKVASTSHYDSYQEFLDVHVNSHTNKNDTEIEWVNLIENE